MNTLQSDVYKTKKIYRELFLKAQESIDRQLNSLKKSSLCSKCREDCNLDFNSIKLLDKLPDGCNFKFWQEAALEDLETRISKDIYEKIQLVDKQREDSSCSMCASCCNLASSEFTHEELKEKAKNGDKFAAEFTSIFIPYESIDEARKIYPDYVSLIEIQFEDDIEGGGLKFYHCPKIGPDNLCTDYENRPQICRDFPTNPLVVFPPACGYRKWKDEVEVQALLLHALVEIVGFYKEKLKEVV